MSAYYPDRTYDFLIQAAAEKKILDLNSLTKFEKWIAGGNAADVKKEDALCALFFLNQRMENEG
ncbi:hypothetical protein [Methanolapillus ohkumae]|uniref:hypothetical protein n=1 Tax=Methanolapillus ohkumae TaxID=3028298 RepID=UPI0030B90082